MLDEVIRAQRRLWQRVWLQIGAGGLWGAILAAATAVFGDSSQLAATLVSEAGSGLLNSVSVAVLGSFGIALAMHVRSWGLVKELREADTTMAWPVTVGRPHVLEVSDQANRALAQADTLGRLRYFDSAVALTAMAIVAAGVLVALLSLIADRGQGQAFVTLCLALLLTVMLGEAGGVPLRRLGHLSAQVRAERGKRLAHSLDLWSELPGTMTERAVRIGMALHVALSSLTGCTVVLAWVGVRNALGMDPPAIAVLLITCAMTGALGPFNFLYLRTFALALMDQQVLLGWVMALLVVFGNALYVSLAVLWPGLLAPNMAVLAVSAVVVLMPYLVQLCRPKAAGWKRLHVVPALETSVRRRTQKELDELCQPSCQTPEPAGSLGRWYWRLSGRSP